MSSTDDILKTTTETPSLPTVTDFGLHIDDILASSRRLWVRGGVRLPSASGWLAWWRGQATSPLPAQLEVRIGGQPASAEVQLAADGSFEAQLALPLPATRRGWRVARTKLTIGQAVAENCAVALYPPANSREAIVVVLPQRGTSVLACAEEEPHKREHLCYDCDQAHRIGVYLHQLVRNLEGPKPVYYLGVKDGDDGSARQLAMTLNALGWPAGNMVLLPAPKGDTAPTLLKGIDRLRWLFANSLTLAVVNLEEELADGLDTEMLPREDRARVGSVVCSLNDLPLASGESTSSRAALYRPTRSYRVTRWPIVYCHGLIAVSALRMQLPEKLNYFLPLEPFLRERGFDCFFPEVGATSSVVQRAEQLRDQITRFTDEPVNLIAHSMGGLDARYMITHLGMADRVRSLTTISTPHHGTYLADWFLQNYRSRVPLLLALEMLGLNTAGFRDSCPPACKTFNDSTPDMPEVSYFSYGASVPQARVHPLLRRPWTVLTPIEGPNDGMVSVTSAHWGEYLGTIPADHFAQTPDGLLVHPAGAFDSLNFYLQLAEDLAWRGF